MAGAGNTRPGGQISNQNLLMNEATFQIPALNQVLADLADIKKLLAEGKEQAGAPMKYARCSTLAKAYDMSQRNMAYILARGVMAGKIRKLGGKNPDVTRGEVTTYHVADVEAYMIETRGGKEE